MQYVYLVTNTLNGKRYVGITGDPKRRWRDHQRAARRGSRYLLHQAIVRHGIEHFVFEVRQELNTRDEAIDIEARLIAELETVKNGYNLSEGGAAPILSSEARANLSNALRQHFESPEARKKAGDSMRGRPKTQEHRQRISEGQRGRVQSAETRRKISEAWARKRTLEKPEA